MEPMKVSFGFSKLTKKPNLIPNGLKPEKKVELIDCLEGSSIMIKDPIIEEKQSLVIPLKEDQRNLVDRIKARKKAQLQKPPSEDTRPDSELTDDELIARQLLREAQQRLNGSETADTKVSILPLSKSLEGEKEPTLDDYDSVPISDYGLALLRGMGWKDGQNIGKNGAKMAPISVPELRPKGLGLGASKAVQNEVKQNKSVDKEGNELVLKKGCFAKVIAGAQKGNYCEVQGFDEEAGRVIIRTHPKMEIININEMMLVPVIKEEFAKGSKIINNAKYEEYKKISDDKLDKIKKEGHSSKEDSKPKYSSDEDYYEKSRKKKHDKSKTRDRSRSRSRRRRRKYSDSEDEYKRKNKKDKSSRDKYKSKR